MFSIQQDKINIQNKKHHTSSGLFEKATDNIYMDLCRAFDTGPYNILVSSLERHGFNEWII